MIKVPLAFSGRERVIRWFNGSGCNLKRPKDGWLQMVVIFTQEVNVLSTWSSIMVTQRSPW